MLRGLLNGHKRMLSRMIWTQQTSLSLLDPWAGLWYSHTLHDYLTIDPCGWGSQDCVWYTEPIYRFVLCSSHATFIQHCLWTWHCFVFSTVSPPRLLQFLLRRVIGKSQQLTLRKSLFKTNAPAIYSQSLLPHTNTCMCNEPAPHITKPTVA